LSRMGTRHEWSPSWAPHVKGYYYEREIDPITHIPEEAEVGGECTHPGCTTVPKAFKRMCMSGQFRTWISTFARLHLHRDTLNDPMPPRGT